MMSTFQIRDVIKLGNQHLLIDTSFVENQFYETAVFNCDENGMVTNWTARYLKQCTDNVTAVHNHNSTVCGILSEKIHLSLV